MTHALLWLMISTISNSTLGETDLSLPAWTGPRASTIWTQSSLYASLSLCILSALGAIPGKQWLGHYARADVGGTADDRQRARKRKREALRAWHFTTILEAMAALLQIGLLLFGIGVAMLLWNQQRLIAGVVLGATIFGSIFYPIIFIASVASADCPFKTPTPDVVRNFFQSQRQKIHAWLWELEVTVAMSPPKGPKMTMLLKRLVHPIMDIIFRPQDALPPVFKKNNRKRSQTQAGTRLEDWELVGSTLCFTTVDRGLEPWISESGQEMDMMSIQWLLTNSADKGVMMSALAMIEEVRWPTQRELCPIIRELLCWLVIFWTALILMVASSWNRVKKTRQSRLRKPFCTPLTPDHRKISQASQGWELGSRRLDLHLPFC
ncbi:hypothetical protein M407DRAFT_25303 [Tulasnella calospora MUT 4182]|uniref:DUF6535 domain-containing protein n=1 Tax=Tulasnella calospora MUT 4182 TaxID=1051891 RepID=A0A0C3Q777_9AGAM|nr:hypothetical protein M407DRAFT_25303 [Tulasnella calospora MUT 4182]